MSEDAALLEEPHHYEVALARREPTGLDGRLMGLIDDGFVGFGASSVCVRRDGRWRMRFHQGTRTD